MPVELPLFTHWEQFLLWFLPRTGKLPRSARFTFAGRLQGLALDVLEGIVEARYTRRKQAILRRVNLDLEKLRVLTRLAHRLELLDGGAYEQAARGIDEAGRMVGGWLKQQMQSGPGRRPGECGPPPGSEAGS